MECYSTNNVAKNIDNKKRSNFCIEIDGAPSLADDCVTIGQIDGGR